MLRLCLRGALLLHLPLLFQLALLRFPLLLHCLFTCALLRLHFGLPLLGLPLPDLLFTRVLLRLYFGLPLLGLLLACALLRLLLCLTLLCRCRGAALLLRLLLAGAFLRRSLLLCFRRCAVLWRLHGPQVLFRRRLPLPLRRLLGRPRCRFDRLYRWQPPGVRRVALRLAGRPLARMRETCAWQFARMLGRSGWLLARGNRMHRVPEGLCGGAVASSRWLCRARRIRAVRRSGGGRMCYRRDQLHPFSALRGRRSRSAQLLYLCGGQGLAVLGGDDFLTRRKRDRPRRRCVARHDGSRERLMPLEHGRMRGGTTHAEAGRGRRRGRAHGHFGARKLRPVQLQRCGVYGTRAGEHVARYRRDRLGQAAVGVSLSAA